MLLHNPFLINFVVAMNILKAEKTDAPLIAEAIIEAVGEEITCDFAGDKGVQAVREMFTALAAREDSQYSYLNVLKGVDDDGNIVGLTVSYDGGRLAELREAFFEEAKRHLGKDMRGKMPDETVAGEMYLDTLAVFEPYRRHGYARILLEATHRKSLDAGLPLGLLVDKSNARARRLYDSFGFKQVGRPTSPPS